MKSLSLSLSLLLLIAASSLSAAPAVVASIKPLQLIAQAIVGDLAAVDVVLPPYADPHNYALKPSDLRKLDAADLVLWIGADFEYYLAKPLAARAHQNVLDLSSLLEQPVTAHTNPHIWLSPSYAVRMANAVAWRLSDLDVSNREQYQRNLANFLAALQQLDRRIARELEPLQEVAFLVYHDAYFYFERDYGLQAAGAITANLELRPGARQLLALRELVRERQVTCLFTEPGAQRSLVELIRQDAELFVQELDPMATEAAVNAQGYLQFIAKLAEDFRRCLTGPPA